MALGARSADVIGMVLRQGMALVGLGSGVGLMLGIGAGKLLAAWLLGIPAIDLVTFAGTIVLFASIGLVACYVPVRRATQIDAMEALRYE